MADTLMFVNGLGDCSGADDTNGGGGLHSVAGIAQGDYPTLAEMLLYMASDGGPVKAVTDAAYTAPGASTDQWNSASISDGLAYIGLYAYLDHPDWEVGETPVRALIIGGGTGFVTTASIGYGTEARDRGIIRIGGAFATVNQLIDKSPDPTDGFITHGHINAPPADNHIIDISGGQLVNNGQLTGIAGAAVILECYNDYPGDKGIVTFDGGGTLAAHAFLIDDIDLVKHVGFRMYNTAGVGGSHGWNVGATSAVSKCIFDSCEADDCFAGIYYGPNSSDCVFNSCSYINGDSYGMLVRGNAVLNNVLSQGNALDNLEVDATAVVVVNGGTFDGALVGGTHHGIQVEHADAVVIVTNAISSNNGGSNFVATLGTLIVSYSNTYNPSAADDFINAGNNLAVDPQFDADYKPHNMQVLQGGMGGAAMGAYPAKIGNKIDNIRFRYNSSKYSGSL